MENPNPSTDKTTQNLDGNPKKKMVERVERVDVSIKTAEQICPACKKAIQRATQLAYGEQEKRIRLSNELTKAFRNRKNIKNWVPKDPLYGMEDNPHAMETLVLAHKGGKEPGDLIPTQEENSKVETYLRLQKDEAEAFEAILPLIETLPIYNEYLAKEPAIPTGILGILIAWFDIERAKYPSSFWSYAGLQPQKNEKSKPKQITSFDDLPNQIGSHHNPFVKAKLVSELGHKLSRNSPRWKTVYDDYKTKIQTQPDKTIRSKSHLHNMAIRYMLKEFLKEYHITWRRIEGLPEPQAYTGPRPQKNRLR